MANSKIITYDLCSPDRKYNTLYNKIKSYSKWARISESSWLVSTTDTCKQVADNLKSALDSNDRLFIAELTGEGAWFNTLCEGDYLKENI